MRIAVAGAGIAGLAAALALARAGFSVAVYERTAIPGEVGAGIQLSPNAMHVLGRLGLAAAVSVAAVAPEAVVVRAWRDGRRLARLPLGAVARRRWGAPYLVVHRADLHAALLAAAADEPAVTLRFDAAVAAVSQPAAGGIAFAAGGATERADLLVGADGVGSALRSGWFGRPAAGDSGLVAWRATLAAASAPAALAAEVGLWLGPGRHAVHYPLRGGAEINIVVVARQAGAAAPPLDGAAPALADLAARVPQWTPWPLRSVDPGLPWRRGAAILIGDAAHAMLPTAAQGGAQAIEDAWQLAAALAARPDDVAAALAAYETARHRRVLRVARMSRRNLRIYGLVGVPAAARDRILAALPGAAHLRRLDWLYGWRPPTIP